MNKYWLILARIMAAGGLAACTDNSQIPLHDHQKENKQG